MDRVYFEIFKPDGKFHLTPNWIVAILWGVTILFLWIFESFIPIHSTFRIIWLVCISAVSFYYLINSFFTYEPLNGILQGELEFSDDSIRINNEKFELKDIDKLDLAFGNYYGKRSTNYRGNFNPTLSQGVENWVKFVDKSNQEHQVYFKCAGEHSYLLVVPFINEAIRLCKMSNYRAEDIIGKENVHYR